MLRRCDPLVALRRSRPAILARPSQAAQRNPVSAPHDFRYRQFLLVRRFSFPTPYRVLRLEGSKVSHEVIELRPLNCPPFKLITLLTKRGGLAMGRTSLTKAIISDSREKLQQVANVV